MTARLATLVLAACSFGCLSEQPIASGSPEPVDPSLLGNWRCLFADEADPSTLTITEVEGRGVRAVFSGGDSKPSTFTGYAVKFEGKRLLNVRLSSNFWFDAPPRSTIFCDHYFSFYIYISQISFHSVVCIDNWRCNNGIMYTVNK